MILLAKSAHLVLKAPPGVMLPLPVDVLHQRAQVRWPHGEQSIPALPRESGDPMLLHPRGRRRLNLRNNLRRGSGGGKAQGQMHMVRNATNSKAFAIELPRRTRQIRMKSRANLVGDQRLPFLCAEHNRDQIQSQRLRHDSLDVPGLQPSLFVHHPYPGLRPGLLCRRAYGPQTRSTAKTAGKQDMRQQPDNSPQRFRTGYTSVIKALAASRSTRIIKTSTAEGPITWQDVSKRQIFTSTSRAEGPPT